MLRAVECGVGRLFFSGAQSGLKEDFPMSSARRQKRIETTHGVLAVEETGQGTTPVLLIHGNSTCRGVFRNQIEGPLAEKYRFITFDLPGHGESEDAPDPQRSYTRPGLADAAIELLVKLDVRDVVVLGWSLGGHIAIEMIPRLSGMRGVMICGAPPVRSGQFSEGFGKLPQLGGTGRQILSEAETQSFVEEIVGKPAEPFLCEAVRRADGRFRKRLFEAARAGEGVDQRLIVETSPVPVAVVNGGADRVVNLDYFDRVKYSNLWEGRCYRMGLLGHAPFWESPKAFDLILERFLQNVIFHGDAAGTSSTF